jgi:hypothetical protein
MNLTITSALNTVKSWEDRVAAAKQRLADLQAGIVRALTNAQSYGLSATHRNQVIEALGLEPPAEKQWFKFKYPVTLTRTTEVLAHTEAEAAELFRAAAIEANRTNTGISRDDVRKASRDDNLNRDVSGLPVAEPLKTEDTGPGIAPPALTKEQLIVRYEDLDQELADLKQAAYLQAVWLRDTVIHCTDGINTRLKALGITELPEKKVFTTTVPVTVDATYRVRAYDAETALKETKKVVAQNQRNKAFSGQYVIKDSGEPTLVS